LQRLSVLTHWWQRSRERKQEETIQCKTTTPEQKSEVEIYQFYCLFKHVHLTRRWTYQPWYRR
jgi:hypothetical protein